MISVLFCRKKVDVSFGVDEFHDVCVNTDHKTGLAEFKDRDGFGGKKGECL